MCRKLTYQIVLAFVSVLVAAGACKATEPGLIGWWTFDEASGTVAGDSSGSANDGAIKGDPQWVAGKIGSALELDGNGDYVEIGGVGISGAAARTVAGWARASTTSIPAWTTVFGFAPGGSIDGTYLDLEVDDTGNYVVNVQGWQAILGPVDTQWHHFAMTYHGEGGSWYLDGQLVDSLDGAVGTIDQFRIGAGVGSPNYFPGAVDEVRIYDRSLTSDEIMKLMAGPRSYDPDPADGALHKGTTVTLGWRAGDGAVSHDVYLGDNFDDVNDGADEAFQGNQTAVYLVAGYPGNPLPEGLVPGTTYYWRIDEVQADGAAAHKGDIWSFWVPSKIAYDPAPADGAEFVDVNAVFTWTPGFEAKLHTAHMSTNFDDVNSAAGGPPLGHAIYSPGTLEAERVYYWRIDEFDGFETHRGNIWSFTTPGAVGNPLPANGAADTQMIAKLAWTPADNAVSHELYFGTDMNAVKNATSASPEYVGPRALGDETHDPGKLAWNTAYYWRVDEIYPAETIKGLVWSFTTAEFISVDDFESYDDIDPPPGQPGINRIFDKWIDGFLTPTTNGAIVGNDVPPYAEQTIVHRGGQSMPYRYDNNLKTSEATLTLVYPRDWTEEGVTKLSLWFRGDAANAAERMFVAVNGNAVVYHDDPAATQMIGWNEWVIDLTEFAGVDLTNVSTVTLGFGTRGSPAAGGTGKMYFDDIALY